ncbi:MAG: CRISPR-associated endonuclease Cas1 [Planctomycetota bacterium]|nr:MAG: CRISPR-associated endonuclease Cas1 [Planctomycetota bacterium]
MPRPRTARSNRGSPSTAACSAPPGWPDRSSGIPLMNTIAVTEQGTRLALDGPMLSVVKGERTLKKLRLNQVDQLLLFGRVEVTSAALAGLARRGIDVVFLSAAGQFRARLVGPASKNVTLRLQQYRRTTDPAFALSVARRIVQAKIRNQRHILLRAQPRLKDPAVADALATLRLAARRAANAPDIDTLRGIEGHAAATYFSQFGKLILNDAFRFETRSRRPPRDPVNACLSFGYALLGTLAENEILRTGLDHTLGFFHQPAYGRPSLVLDLIEEFRPQVDQLVLRLINLRQLGPGDFRRVGPIPPERLLYDAERPEPDASSDETPPPATETPEDDAETPELPDVFDESPQPEPPEPDGPVIAVYLDDPGRKVFIDEFFRRFRTPLLYPRRGVNLPLRAIVREQAYHLARVITGDDPEYEPFGI